MASSIMTEETVRQLIKTLEATRQVWEEIKMAESAGIPMADRKLQLKDTIDKTVKLVSVYGKQYGLSVPTQLPVINV